VAIALTAVLALFTAVAGLVLLSGRASSSIAVARRIFGGPGPGRIVFPGPGRIVFPGPFVGTQIAGIDVRPLALIALLVGLLGIGLLVALYWSPRFGFLRRRHESPRSPNWH
jgi:hypothetical protein